MDVSQDTFARPVSTSLSPHELNGEGKGQALVLRYAACNLRCPLCYAWKYAWYPGKHGHRYQVADCLSAIKHLPDHATKIVWVRIQGGEPCLNYTRILNTLEAAYEALRTIEEKGLNYYDVTRCVIQTNGIPFAKMGDAQIAEIVGHLRESLPRLKRSRIVFELSFKSANDPKTLDDQSAAFDTLLNRVMVPIWGLGINNTAIYPIAGLGPSIDAHNEWLIPIDDSFLPEEVPLFHPKTWAPSFQNVLHGFINAVIPAHDAYHTYSMNPQTRGGTKVAIEELEPSGRFQTAWISGYAGAYDAYGATVPDISRLLRKSSREVNRQWLALFSGSDR